MYNSSVNLSSFDACAMPAVTITKMNTEAGAVMRADILISRLAVRSV